MRRVDLKTQEIPAVKVARRRGETARTSVPPNRAKVAARAALGVVGELLITMGVVVLLFVVYELYVTDWMSEGKQREAAAELDDRWSQDRRPPTEPIDGKAFARIRVPAFGTDYSFTIQEGVGRVIVTPDRGDAVWPVPYKPVNVLPKGSQASLLTLTTCHPRFSNRQRMIIHAVLTDRYQKAPSVSYSEVLREIGEA